MADSTVAELGGMNCLDNFSDRSVEFVSDWLRKEGLPKLCNLFEGIVYKIKNNNESSHGSSELDFVKYKEMRNQCVFSIAVPGMGGFDHKSIINGGAFDWHSCPGVGEFDHKHSKVQMPGEGGGMFKLRFDRC